MEKDTEKRQPLGLGACSLQLFQWGFTPLLRWISFFSFYIMPEFNINSITIYIHHRRTTNIYSKSHEVHLASKSDSVSPINRNRKQTVDAAEKFPTAEIIAE